MIEFLVLPSAPRDVQARLAELALQEIAPLADSAEVDLISDEPWTDSEMAAATRIADRAGRHLGETVVPVDVRNQEELLDLVSIIFASINIDVWIAGRAAFSSADGGTSISLTVRRSQLSRIAEGVKVSGYNINDLAYHG